MALTTPTTLAVALGANDLFVNVTSATGISAGMFLRVNKEFMVVDNGYVSGTAIPVHWRGNFGSRVVAHQILSPVQAGLMSDLPDLNSGEDAQIPLETRGNTTIGADVTLSATSAPPLPTKDTVYNITKATACAITLPAPSAGIPDGTFVTFYSTTAAAHTVTYTAGFYGDTTSSDVATFAAKVGASATFVASKGTWGVQALANVTLG